MEEKNIPYIFSFLLSNECVEKSDILKTADGFYVVNQSISNILSTKDIFDFPDPNGEKLKCDRFFDDWFLYAVQDDNDYTYSLLKLREQEYDAEEGLPAVDSVFQGLAPFYRSDSRIVKRQYALHNEMFSIK